MGDHTCVLYWPAATGKESPCYECDRPQGLLWIRHSDPWGWNGFQAQLWHSASQRGQRRTAEPTTGGSHSGSVASGPAAERNRSDGLRIPDSSQSVSPASCAGRCLQIAARWIINHNGTINTLFSHVLLTLKMSEADGTLPAAKLWCRAKKEARVEFKKRGGEKKWCQMKKKISQGVFFFWRCMKIKYKPAPMIWLSLPVFSDYAEANTFTVSLHRWTQEMGSTHSNERNGEGGESDSSRQMITQMRGKEKMPRTERKYVDRRSFRKHQTEKKRTTLSTRTRMWCVHDIFSFNQLTIGS